jgi:hypothetical protein
MAVSAFQAGDCIEAERLSQTVLRHQEQHQVLNNMARAKAVETFNQHMPDSGSVTLSLISK